MAEADLCDAMRVALSDTFMFYVEAHIFHWNVTGPRFSQLHSLFGDIYEDTFEAADGLAERIRALGDLAPMTAGALFQSNLKDDQPITDADEMVDKLVADNEVVRGSLQMAQALAEACGEVGVGNYLQDRLDRHAKWGWMLTATAEPATPSPAMRRYARSR